jgi:imidazolonepropionase-like amidohydrolase
VASTDAGIPNVRHEDLAKALPVFSHYAGLSPFEALRSATSEAARALAIADIAGTIAPGLSADLVFLEGDPLSDLTCIQQPALVMMRGREIEATA